MLQCITIPPRNFSKKKLLLLLLYMAVQSLVLDNSAKIKSSYAKNSSLTCPQWELFHLVTLTHRYDLINTLVFLYRSS